MLIITTQCLTTLPYFLFGDINIDILESINNADKDQYINFIYIFGFMAAITKPIRVMGLSNSCIDHIFIICFDYSNMKFAVLKTSYTIMANCIPYF